MISPEHDNFMVRHKNPVRSCHSEWSEESPVSHCDPSPLQILRSTQNDMREAVSHRKLLKESDHLAMQYFNDDQMIDLLSNIRPQLCMRIILASANANLSIMEYIERILEQNVPPEPAYLHEGKQGLNKAAIEDLHRFQEYIRQKHPDQVFEDSSEQLHQIREERMRQLEDR